VLVFFMDRWFVKDSPLAIGNSETKGRFVYCLRDLQKGELIIEEEPYVIVVDSHVQHSVCNTCWKLSSLCNSIVSRSCSEQVSWRTYCHSCCYVWYCSQQCLTKDFEHINSLECLMLRRLKQLPYLREISSVNRTIIRLIIRLISKKYQELNSTNQPEVPSNKMEQNGTKAFPCSFDDLWYLISNEVLFDETHMSTITWLSDLIVDDLLVSPEEKKLITKEDIIALICREECNSFGIWLDTEQPIGLGIYLRSSFFNHSCAPNVAKLHKEDLHTLGFYALCDIPKGTELTVTYIDLSHKRKERQYELKEYYFFRCTCDRCGDDLTLDEEDNFDEEDVSNSLDTLPKKKKKKIDRQLLDEYVMRELVCQKPGCLGSVITFLNGEKVCRYCGKDTMKYYK